MALINNSPRFVPLAGLGAVAGTGMSDGRRPSDQLLQMETACGALMRELQVRPLPLRLRTATERFAGLMIARGWLRLCAQVIWDEIGEQDAARDTMLLELQQECLEAYRRKVDQANRCRAQLRQAIADAQAELTAVCSVMAETPVLARQVGHSSTCCFSKHPKEFVLIRQNLLC